MIPGHARAHALFEAEGHLRETTEAVAKARDAVVDAAIQWQKIHWDAALEIALRKRVSELQVAQVAEVEARERLEALR